MHPWHWQLSQLFSSLCLIWLASLALMQSCRCWLLKVWFGDQQHPHLLGLGWNAASLLPTLQSYWFGIFTLTRSLMILMQMKVWEAMVYKIMTMNNLFTFLEIIRWRKGQSQSPLCGEGRDGRRQEGCLGKEIETMFCFLSVLPSPLFQPPVTTHTRSVHCMNTQLHRTTKSIIFVSRITR